MDQNHSGNNTFLSGTSQQNARTSPPGNMNQVNGKKNFSENPIFPNYNINKEQPLILCDLCYQKVQRIESPSDDYKSILMAMRRSLEKHELKIRVSLFQEFSTSLQKAIILDLPFDLQKEYFSYLDTDKKALLFSTFTDEEKKEFYRELDSSKEELFLRLKQADQMLLYQEFESSLNFLNRIPVLQITDKIKYWFTGNLDFLTLLSRTNAILNEFFIVNLRLEEFKVISGNQEFNSENGRLLKKTLLFKVKLPKHIEDLLDVDASKIRKYGKIDSKDALNFSGEHPVKKGT